ncbi:MAG: SseB family protein [Actinomycetes bacterium]
MSGRPVPDPGFAGDAGEADPALARALADHAAGHVDTYAVHAALSAARVLVPVVAVPSEPGREPASGQGSEPSTDMAVVTLVGRDGSRALPVFTCTDTLAGWRADARPVPVEARHAALAAYAEDARAVLVDPGGPVRHVVSGPALRALAEGRPHLPPAADPDVTAAVARALDGLEGLVGHRLEPSQDQDVRVVLEAAPGGDPATTARVAHAAAERLRAEDVLRARLGAGVEVAVEGLSRAPDR